MRGGLWRLMPVLKVGESLRIRLAGSLASRVRWHSQQSTWTRLASEPAKQSLWASKGSDAGSDVLSNSQAPRLPRVSEPADHHSPAQPQALSARRLGADEVSE